MQTTRQAGEVRRGARDPAVGIHGARGRAGPDAVRSRFEALIKAIRAVPSSIREGSPALGATQWQTIWRHVLPGSIGGIATGVILALSRAIGETAPLLVIGAAGSLRFNPDGLDSSFSALPIQIFVWTGQPQPEFLELAAGAIVVLMIVLLLRNSVAIWLRNRYEQKW